MEVFHALVFIKTVGVAAQAVCGQLYLAAPVLPGNLARQGEHLPAKTAASMGGGYHKFENFTDIFGMVKLPLKTHVQRGGYLSVRLVHKTVISAFLHLVFVYGRKTVVRE